MPVKFTNAKKTGDWQDTYDLPDQLDLTKVKVIGVGIAALEKHIESRSKNTLQKLRDERGKTFLRLKELDSKIKQLAQKTGATKSVATKPKRSSKNLFRSPKSDQKAKR